jgi:hypothetical protein
VRAADLFAAYQANQVGADSLYRGAVIIVYGTIENIGRDIFSGTAYVAFRESSSIGCVQCMFASAREYELEDLRPGQVADIKGRCLGGVMLQVILDDCSLVDVVAPPSVPASPYNQSPPRSQSGAPRGDYMRDYAPRK